MAERQLEDRAPEEPEDRKEDFSSDADRAPSRQEDKSERTVATQDTRSLSERVTSEFESWRNTFNNAESKIRQAVDPYLTSLTLVDGGVRRPGDKGPEAQPRAAEQPKQPEDVASGDNKWHKGENGWQLLDAAGKPVDRFNGQVEDVTRGEDGRAIIKLKDGRRVEEKTDGSTLEFNKEGKLGKITCPDGSSREMTWDGDEIKSVKTNSGVFNRAVGQNGKYKDEWIPAGSQSNSGWRGQIEVNDKTGDYTLKPLEGDKKGSSLTWKSDLSQETVAADGKREVTLPNKDVMKFNKEGNLTEAKYSDGSTRKFTWTENPNAKGQDDKYSLATVHVVRPDGSQYYHQKGSGDNWTVSRLQNGSWSAAESEKLSFNVNSKTGEYSYKDDGVTTRMTPGKAGSESVAADGSKLSYDKDGYLAKAEREGRVREFKRENGKVTEINDNGKTWKPSGDGTWQSNIGEKRSGTPFISPNGEFGFEKEGSKTVIKMDGTEFSRSENKDKSVVERRDGQVNTTCTDGSSRAVKTDRSGEPIEESRTRDGKTETWVRGEARDGGHVWKNSQTGAEEVRSQVKVSDTGALSYKKADGTTITARNDGAERTSKEGENWYIDRKGGRPTEVKFGDGYVRQFTYDGDSNSPKTIKVTQPNGTVTDWVRTGQDQYKTAGAAADEKPWNAKIEVTNDGTYKITDLDEKKVTTRKPEGSEVVENQKTGARTEKLNGELVKVSRDGQELEVKREGGKITEMRDAVNNRLYKKVGDEFKVEALDASKPFTKPDDVARKGEAKVDENGAVTYTAENGDRVKQELGKPARVASGAEYINDLVKESKHLTDAQKQRFKESMDTIAARKDLPAKELADVYAHMGRLLEGEAKDSPFSEKQRHDLVDQIAWHIANPTRNEQGQNPNCQVTDMRTAIMMETPSHFARMMADVGTTGKFTTADGTVIVPPVKSLERPTTGEEAKFPPEPGTRTWAGKIWDVTASNVYWQRQTRTPQGETVAKGSLNYELVPASGRRDGGARVHKYWEQNGKTWYQPINNTDGSLIEFPAMNANAMMDAYKQITGKDQKDRMIVHDRVKVTGDGVKVINNENDLHETLQKGPWPKIIQIHTSHPWVYGDSENGTAGGAGGRDGGEHVVVITGYDPKTKKVSVDNSWDPKNDRLAADRQITLSQLYKSTTGQYRPEVQQTTQQRVYYQNGYMQNGVFYQYR